MATSNDWSGLLGYILNGLGVPADVVDPSNRIESRSNDMLKEFAEFLMSRDRCKTFEIDDTWYSMNSNGNVSLVPEIPKPCDPEVRARSVKTLDALIDLLKIEPPEEEVFVVVEGVNDVSVYGTRKHMVIGGGPNNSTYDAYNYQTYYNAEPMWSSDFVFGSSYRLKEFILKLQSQFVDSDELRRILRLVGNIHSDTNVARTDDGVSQKVTVRKGLSLGEEATVNNPFVLAPYRTYPEVEQVASPFILRCDDEAGGMWSLTECDGRQVANSNSKPDCGIPKRKNEFSRNLLIIDGIRLWGRWKHCRPGLIYSVSCLLPNADRPGNPSTLLGDTKGHGPRFGGLRYPVA